MIELTRHARGGGLDGALVTPPYFVKLTDDEIFAHFATVCEAPDLPVCLYNIPGNAVNVMSPGLVGRLADAGPRWSRSRRAPGTGTTSTRRYLAVRDRLRVFCGPSSVFGVPAVLLGADGVIDCFPNVWAPGGLDLYDAARDGTSSRRPSTCRPSDGGSPICSRAEAARSIRRPRRPWTCWASRAAARRGRRCGRWRGRRSRGFAAGWSSWACSTLAAPRPTGTGQGRKVSVP